MCICQMKKAMATHSSTLAWKIPWMEEPGRLQSVGSRRVRQDRATSLSLFTFMHWRRKWQPTPVFLPEESQGREAWWAAIYGVTQSWTRLKWLSSSSSRWDLMPWPSLNTEIPTPICHGALLHVQKYSSVVCCFQPKCLNPWPILYLAFHGSPFSVNRVP